MTNQDIITALTAKLIKRIDYFVSELDMPLIAAKTRAADESTAGESVWKGVDAHYAAELKREIISLQCAHLKIEHEIKRCENNLGAFHVRNNCGTPVADSCVTYSQQELKTAINRKAELEVMIASRQRTLDRVTR